MELNCLITKGGILINFEELKKFLGLKGCESLQKKLTVTHINVIGKKTYPKKMILYKYIVSPDGTTFMCVARFAGIGQLIQKVFQTSHPGDKSVIKMKYNNRILSGNEIHNLPEEELVELKEYQQICFDHMVENIYNSTNIKKGAASCIFVMDTGLGKTYVASALIEKFKEKTLIIIPNTSNLDGWYDPFKLFLTDLKVGEYHSDKKEDGDVVITTIDSALSENFTFVKNKKKTSIPHYEYFKQFGFVIYDEIHDFPTAKRSEIFWRTNFKYVLGLTATPDERLDKMDVVYYKHVGPIVNAKEIPGFANLVKKVEWKGKVLSVNFYGAPEFTEVFTNSVGWVDTVEMQKQFSRDPYRIKLIINYIKEKYSQGRNVFVFAVHRDILENIYSILIQENLPVDITKFMGGVSEEDKQITKNTAQIILTTYSFGKQSVSIKRMDTIIFAQPMRNKMRQTIGRILRIGGDPSIEREIIDIRDMNTPLKSQFSTRKKIYEEKKFPVKKIDVKYTDISLDS